MIISLLFEVDAAGEAEQSGEIQSLEVTDLMTIDELYNIAAADCGIESDKLQIISNGHLIPFEKEKTLKESNISNDQIFIVTLKEALQQRYLSQKPSSSTNPIENVRQTILKSKEIQKNLLQSNPDLLEAAIKDPAKFAAMMESQKSKLFPPRNDKPNEEAVRLQAIAENMASAMEYHPESFASVTMLYLNCFVNDVEVKAFVDCGAQTTIMSLNCAKKCKLEHLIDERFSGIARGVGEGKILGKIHTAQLHLGTQFLPCSLTIIDGEGVPDMLFGLDMLKRYQASIDLKTNSLNINGDSIEFLPESEIPK